MRHDAITITQLLSRIPSTRPVKVPRTLPLMVRILRWLDQRSPAGECVVAASLIFSIGILGYVTGPQISSSLLYLIPVLLVTRVPIKTMTEPSTSMRHCFMWTEL